jgi:signal transduction histidine kinase
VSDRAPPPRRAQEPIQAILSAIVDGVVVVDEQGCVRFANRAAEEMFGLDEGGLVGDEFGFPIVAGVTTELDLVSRGEPCVLEMRVVETTWDDRPALLASLRDITARRRAEEERQELFRAQTARAEAERALRARDRFLAAAAHELKTPITRLRLSIQRTLRRAARQDTVLPDYAEESLRLVDREADHMNRLVGQLLDLARIDNGTFQLQRSPTDLCELVKESVARCQATTTVHRLQLRCPDEPTYAEVDPVVIDQVVSSLVTNAIRFSSAGKEIEIELSKAHGPGGELMQLAVRDQAQFAAEGRIVEQLLQEDGEGSSGLGLSLLASRRMVELHGGQVEVTAADDGGTRVVVTLPIEQAA